MTWAFLYATALLVGLVLAGVTGFIGDLRGLARKVVVPHPDQHSAFLSLAGPRVAVGLVAAGIVGLVLGAQRGSDPNRTLRFALVAGFAGCLLAFALLRARRPTATPFERAVAVSDIPPGGYGQVRLERRGGSVLLAAQSVDSSVIPGGSEVEVVDPTRSVVTIRKQPPA